MDHVPNVPVAHAVDPPRDRDAKYAMIGYHESRECTDKRCFWIASI